MQLLVNPTPYPTYSGEGGTISNVRVVIHAIFNLVKFSFTFNTLFINNDNIK